MSMSFFLKNIKKKPVKEKIHYNSEQEELPLSHKDGSSLYTPISTVRSPCSFNMDNRGIYPNSDQDSEPDRSNPLWKECLDKSVENQKSESVIEEKIPKMHLWEEIMQEYEDERFVLKQLEEEQKEFEPEMPLGLKLTAVQYLQQNIFPILCPALEDTLFQAKKEECLQIQKCIFNGLDHLSELLWNRNPSCPMRRMHGYKYIFDIPFVKLWLRSHPRPIYPLSWIWTKEEAIIVMQSYIRRYFVCRDPDCSEMRKFWQIFKHEKREEERLRELEHIEEVLEIATCILYEIVADAVYKAEEKIHGCFCISKPCHCECKCFKWCKCCKCYKPQKSVNSNFYNSI